MSLMCPFPLIQKQRLGFDQSNLNIVYYLKFHHYWTLVFYIQRMLSVVRRGRTIFTYVIETFKSNGIY